MKYWLRPQPDGERRRAARAWDTRCTAVGQGLIQAGGGDQYTSELPLQSLSAAIAMIVVASQLAAQPLRNEIVWVARQDIALGGLGNQAIGVLLE